MNEKKRKPIFLSMPVIILLSVCTLTLLAPISLIMSIIRFKKYPELSRNNNISFVVSIAMTAIFVTILFTPSTKKEEVPVEKEIVVTKETNNETEAKLTEDEKEETTEIIEEETEKTSLFGYPEQEKELADAGYDMTKIPSRECFLYSYAEYKIIADKTDMKTMDVITEEALNYVTDDSLEDYVSLETMIYNYRGDNIANYISDYLIPLVGDEWQDVCDKASMEYFGYSVYSDQNESTSSNVTINYIESLETTSFDSVYDMGNKTKEDLYSIAESVYQNNSISYGSFNKDVLRDTNNVGNTYKLDMNVTSTSADSSVISAGTNDFAMDIVNGYVDLSLIDMKLLSGDNIIVDCVYLGTTEYNNPVFLATSVTIY